MNRLSIIIPILILVSLIVNAQVVSDTLYFIDGRIEAVIITGISAKTVEYEYPGENIPISTPKERLSKLITKTGREVVFENTTKVKTVFSGLDWDKVEVTNVQSEVEGLIRVENVSSKANGTVFTSLEVIQERAMRKMKMEAAFMGSDVVFFLNQTSSKHTYNVTLNGTAYITKRATPVKLKNGNYRLVKVYKLRPNQFEYEEVLTSNIPETLFFEKNNFYKVDDYYQIDINNKEPIFKNTFQLLKASEDELIFLFSNKDSRGRKVYYNIFFERISLN